MLKQQSRKKQSHYLRALIGGRYQLQSESSGKGSECLKGRNNCRFICTKTKPLQCRTNDAFDFNCAARREHKTLAAFLQ